jgi:hypothetical protein
VADVSVAKSPRVTIQLPAGDALRSGSRRRAHVPGRSRDRSMTGDVSLTSVTRHARSTRRARAQIGADALVREASLSGDLTDSTSHVIAGAEYQLLMVWQGTALPFS